MAEYTYRWGNNLKRARLKGKKCKLLTSGTRNNILIEFEDGERVVTSRRALKRFPADAPPKRKECEMEETIKVAICPRCKNVWTEPAIIETVEKGVGVLCSWCPNQTVIVGLLSWIVPDKKENERSE